MHCLELVHCKNYFNLSKMFVLRLFKKVAKQCYKLAQRSVIKFLVSEMYKP